MSVAEQIRAIADLRLDTADTPARLARLEAETGIPVAAFAAIAEIVTLLLSEEDVP